MGLFGKMKEAQQQAAGAMSNAGGMSGMMSGMKPGGGQAQHAQLAKKLKESGVEAPGTIVALRNTGGSQTEVDVTITPAGGAPYDTTVTQSFIPSQLEGLAVGGAITVKYDPDIPSAALIYGW